MQDAAELVNAVKLVVSGSLTLEEAITAYEDSMRPRGVRDVELSLETAKKTLMRDLKDSPMFNIGLGKASGPEIALESSVEVLR